MLSSVESEAVASLRQCREQRVQLIAETRDKLRLEAIEAMAGRRGVVHHVEQRVTGEVVALCPLAEMLGEVMHLHVVAGALVHMLRHSRDPLAADLRTQIANAYADQQAVRIAALGGVAA